MIGRGLIAAATVASGLWCALPLAFAAGNVTDGHRMAARRCTGCHLIESRQAQVTDTAAPFMQIADDPTRTDQLLRTWLADLQPPMPSRDLSRLEIENLMGYIRSLANTND